MMDLKLTQLTVRKRRESLRLMLDKLKSEPCVDCVAAGRDGVWPIECMQLDHRPNENKIANIGNFVWRGDELGFLTEIKKCDFTCGNCHATRTKARKQHTSTNQRAGISRAMKELHNRPDVKARKSAAQSIAMKRVHEERRRAGIPWIKR
jgi:hypothetical protein